MPAHRDDPGSIRAALGPTNTGKTHLAVERMLAHSSGMIGLPLRLLAREIYDRVVAVKGRGLTALVTGEEKIVPKTAQFFVCTTESMPVGRKFAFVAVDEIQLAADHERGHVFTDRILHARGTQETMLLGASTMTGLVRQLVPDADFDFRERFSQLDYSGPAKLTRLPRRSAIVAFSAESVYAIAELIRRRRGGAAVVMGGLSPRTRNAQVELYQSGEVDFLVATDAIGMGLNMEIDHVAFAESRKFDGRRRRHLTPAELGQIAGRAGRFRNDGTFGETADCHQFTDEEVHALVNHEFAPVERVQWRNSELDLSSLDALLYSLGRPSRNRVLERSREAIDERALAELARDPEIEARTNDAAGVARLWEACRLPDFRKATLDAHTRLIKSLFMHLSGPNLRLPNAFIGAQLEKLDRTGGDVDALAARLAHVRTWAYAAHRSDWTHDPDHWRSRARDIEDRLSDALHECLMQRFVDRRTSALMKGLRGDEDLLAGVSSDGEVTVEGHYVGRLEGLLFKPDAHGQQLEARALRSAALKALRPEINQRLNELAQADADTLKLTDEGIIVWKDEPVGRIETGDGLLRPAVKLTGGELGAGENQLRARTALETWLAEHIRSLLAPVFALQEAASHDDLAGQARGIAWRLHEAGGALARHEIREEIQALEQPERRELRKLGVRIGEHMIYVPTMVKPAPARLNAMLRALHAGDAATAWLPPPGLTSVPNDRENTRAVYAAAGFYPCGSRAVRFDILERLADTIRDAKTEAKSHNFPLTPAMVGLLGSSVEDLRGVLSALGYKRVQKGPDPEKAEGELWGARPRRRPQKPVRKPVETKLDADSPFAALAELRTTPDETSKQSKPKKRRKPRRKTAKAAKPVTAENSAETQAEAEAKPSEAPPKATPETVQDTTTAAPEAAAETAAPGPDA